MFLPLSVTTNVWGADVVYKTAKFGKDYNSKSVQSYSNSWSSTYNGFQVDITNANNNANGWSYIKMGSKNDASTGTITTNAKIDAAITKVTLTIDAITAKNITSITLQTATSSNGIYTSVGTFTKETGTQTITIASPTVNLFYKIEVVCTKSSNGSITISQVDYYTSPEYNITYTGDEHITYSGTKPETIKKEDSGFELEFSVDDGYQLNDVQVKMGGQNLVLDDDYLWEEGYLLILPETDITGDVEIIFKTVATCTTNPTITVGSYSSVTTTTATVSCTGGITSLGSAGCSIESYGFVYGTSSNPTISNTKVQVGTTYTTTGKAFSQNLTGLTANTTYYARPYATNGNGTAYGAQTSFKTLELPKYTITWNVIGEQVGTTTIVEGQEWTLPEVDESCNDKQFVGWTTTEILEEQDEAPAILYTETSQFPLETNTYYAVFANVEVTGTGEYVKLTEALTDYSGEYLIVYEEGSRAFNGGLEESLLDDNDNYISITISDDVIQATDEVENARFIVAKVDGGYSIQSASGLYIGRAANSNGTDIEQTYNENLVNTFPNCSTIRGKGGADIQYNNNTNPSQQNRFRYYASSLNTIALYKKTGTNMTNYTTSCVPTYTITWKNDDDTVLETDKVKENTTPSYDGETPTKEATAQYTYTFAGWTPEISTVTGDQTYTAKFTETLRTYTITWKNGSTVLETDENVPYGDTPSYDGNEPTKEATAQYTYKFAGWNPNVTTVTGNATYNATYNATINTYTITFELQGHGESIPSQTKEYGSVTTAPTTPTVDGYEFGGWYKESECINEYDFNTEITSDVTLYAKWLEIFTVTWMINGEVYTTTEVVEGEPITPPASPDAGDYCGQVFAGWTDAEMEETTNDAPTLYPNPTSFPTASEEAPTTYYAVFADYEN